MKRTTNKAQEAYMLAKANLNALEEIEADIERKYIAEHNIVNADGTTPTRIFCIDDDATFEKANAESAELPKMKANFKDVLEARDLLDEAENGLIAYGLSIAPEAERSVLERAAATNYTTRCKLIDMTLKLDVSTVK